ARSASFPRIRRFPTTLSWSSGFRDMTPTSPVESCIRPHSTLSAISDNDCRPQGRLRRRLDAFGDDPAVLADLAVADEAQLLVGREGAVEEEACRHRASGFGIPLYPAAAETCDQIERPFERGRGDALAPLPLADEVAGDPPIRQLREALLVGGPVLE